MSKGLTKLFDAKDMTVGKPMSNIVQFSIPLLIGNLAQQLYATVDSIVVGHYVGDGALAAVGASGPIINMLIVLFVGIATGAGIMVSQYFGAKQQEQLSKTMGNCVTLTFLAGTLMTIVGVLLTRPVMALLNTPDDIYEMACTYMMICFVGMIGGGYYNIISGVLRGLGDSVFPLIILLICCVLNTVLDVLFVAVFRWGIAGVAWATIISQTISGALCLLRLLRMRNVVHITWKTLKLDKFYALQLARLGLPSGITQAIFSLSMIVVQSLTNSMGTNVIACNTVVMRVDGFAMMPNFTFGTAMTTFAGQNMGAGLIDRVHRGTRDGMKLAVGCAVILTACILLFGENLMHMFTQTAEVVALGMQMMRTIAVGYIAMAITQVLSGVMRGAGDTMTPMWISLITTVALRVPIAYIWAYFTRTPAYPTGSPEALFFSLLISWVMGAIINIIAFRNGKWRTKSITGVKAA
ncbi:MAG: MATE family efflux transporter [Candidatus Spyradocola sp.]|nr:MATE family efflux transporter [Candidatus Spyradocola sp.]